MNVAVSILFMVVYGHSIDPGHEEQYYQDHIKVVAPKGHPDDASTVTIGICSGWDAAT